MATTLFPATRNAACNTIVDLVDAGDSAGEIEIRDGTSVLVTFTCDDPAFGSASLGSATLEGTPLQAIATGTGEADNFRVLDSDGTVIRSGDVVQGNPSSPASDTLTLDNTSINSGQTVTITSYTFTVPGTSA